MSGDTAMSTAAIDLTCADIASLEPAHAAALVYYIAGFKDGQSGATVNPGAMVGGLTLSAAAVIDACAADDTATIATVIDAQGGTGGSAAATTPAPTDAATSTEPAPADAATDAMAPADGAAAPADSGTDAMAPADGAAAPATGTETPAEGTTTSP
jgi:hypothetical protein